MGKINVEAEKNELILENEFGDKVIIPAKKRQWVQKQIEKGNHADLDNYISTLPIKSDFAEEGSVVPGDPTKKVKVYTGKPEYFVQGVAPRNGERKNEDGSVSTHLMSYTSADDVHYAYPTLFQDGDKWIQLDDKDDWAAFKEAQKRKELFKFDNEEDAKKFAEGSWKTENIKEYDIDSPEYRELYNSGAIANYDKNSDTYILSKPLDEVVITAEAPQWAKDKRKYESQYTKDWYIDNNMPKFSRSMGVSATNMHSNNVKEYEEFINNKVAESILKRNSKVGSSNNERLAWYNSLSEKEREIINNSHSADKFSPAVRAYMESQSNEAKKYGILETFRDADKLAQSVEGTPERFRIFPNAENNIESYINPLMWIGDMAKGLGNIPKNIKEENYLKAVSSVASPLLGGALGGLGAKTTGQFVKNIFLPLGGLEENIVKGGKNLVIDGLAGKLSKADKVIDATKAGSKVLNKLDNVVKPAISIADDVTKQTYKTTWQLEELPGLHLKSTMTDGAISKIVEPKTGLVNVEQALGIIGKESGGADKVALIKQGLGENIPKKMDYNEFRKVVQDQLIPLEKQFSKHSSGYGIDRLGYYNTDDAYSIGKTWEEAGFTRPLENQTLILGNKSKFGRGSSAHGNPDETLGHAHFLRDAETPDVLTVTQIQSDAFQGTHRIMPKNTSNATALERQKKSLQRMEELQERNKSVLNKMKTEGLDEAGLPVQDYQIKQFEDIVKAQEQSNLFKKADIENFTQKQLLDKNHQERYLQELVDYAGKRGDVNKVRLPTSETAAKVQGYEKITLTGDNTPGFADLQEKISIAVRQGNQKEADELMKIHDKILETPYMKYSNEHQTILKKYSEQPKTIKKLFGQEPKIVTDSKGNTWYEFDIPKKFKEGKGEIKAFTTVGAIGTGAALSNQSQNKTK